MIQIMARPFFRTFSFGCAVYSYFASFCISVIWWMIFIMQGMWVCASKLKIDEFTVLSESYDISSFCSCFQSKGGTFLRHSVSRSTRC